MNSYDIGIYIMILSVIFMRYGIEAFKIYIAKNKHSVDLIKKY